MKIFIVFLLFILSLHAQALKYEIKPDWLKASKFMKIDILDSQELKFDTMDGIKVSELSALAFHNDKLYALSDRGYVYHFNIKIKDKKIAQLELKEAFELKDKNEESYKKSKSDSEGMAFVDDTLLISFENKPRIEVFSLKAKKIKNYEINKDLEDIKNYQDKNKALEAVTYNNKYGVVTAPEIPLKKQNKDFHILYSKNTTWKFPACGKITAMEFINENDILVLEKNYNKKKNQRVLSISKVSLNNCVNVICKSEVLAELESVQGWKIDNFEGLTKVGANTFLMVSDNNGSFFQKTLLVLFEIASTE
ncbi:esterase-like activity of phytase family protein [bacterium]|nr:esterase-like activity of phytase family protein [bacterium]MBU1994173.1 esterase-like activity of phytase family protein [bacterium]